MKGKLMKTAFVSALVLTIASSIHASEEGILPLSSFRIESNGVGESGKIVLEGKQNDQWQIIELKLTAFGHQYVVPPEKLRPLAGFGANGIWFSYEVGYKELGGRTIYVQFQKGFTSGTEHSALITITEDGNVEVREIKKEAAAAAKPTGKATAPAAQQAPGGQPPETAAPTDQADAEKAKAALLRLIRSDRTLFEGADPDRLEKIAVSRVRGNEPQKYDWGAFDINAKPRTYSAVIEHGGGGAFYSGRFTVDTAGRWTAEKPNVSYASPPVK
jgi:hypothetical protein